MAKGKTGSDSAADNSRLKHFVEVEKTHGAEGTNPAAKKVHERPAERDEGARLREYTRIERGRTA
ncbi:hypothetical protein [Defluviimonas sp. SAOS-178_SWC]|uniref:hypothetical protein n=1 Tax=Defluviimonas sp. SAOS-178_SWC TaxID=3121287 RepID=UPI003221C9BF